MLELAAPTFEAQRDQCALGESLEHDGRQFKKSQNPPWADQLTNSETKKCIVFSERHLFHTLLNTSPGSTAIVATGHRTEQLNCDLLYISDAAQFQAAPASQGLT